MKRGLTTATAKDTCILVLYQRVVKRNAEFIKPTWIVTSLDKTNVTLAHGKQYLKIVSGIIKSRSTTLNIKMRQNYQKNVGKLKSTVEHQKSHGRLSEYVVLTIQTVSAAFYA